MHKFCATYEFLLEHVEETKSKLANLG